MAKTHVVITRTRRDPEPWVSALEQQGATVSCAPLVEREPTPWTSEMQRELETMASGDVEAAAFLSPSAVELFLSQPGARDALQQVSVWAVAQTTAAALQEHHISSVKLPNEPTAKGLCKALLQSEQPQGVAVIQAQGGTPHLLEGLRKAHVSPLLHFEMYRTVAVSDAKLTAQYDWLIVASPSAAEAFAAGHTLPQGARLASIGPTTTAACQRAGLIVSAEAAEPTIKGIVAAMAGALNAKSGRPGLP